MESSSLPSVHKYTSTQVHKYTSTQVHKYTSTQVHKYTSTQVHANFLVGIIALAIGNLNAQFSPTSFKNFRGVQVPYSGNSIINRFRIILQSQNLRNDGYFQNNLLFFNSRQFISTSSMNEYSTSSMNEYSTGSMNGNSTGLINK